MVGAAVRLEMWRGRPEVRWIGAEGMLRLRNLGKLVQSIQTEGQG